MAITHLNLKHSLGITHPRNQKKNWFFAWAFFSMNVFSATILDAEKTNNYSNLKMTLINRTSGAREENYIPKCCGTKFKLAI